MAVHIFVVVVETDDSNLGAPEAQAIADEIESNLGYEANISGIVHIDVQQIRRSYRQLVEGSHES